MIAGVYFIYGGENLNVSVYAFQLIDNLCSTFRNSHRGYFLVPVCMFPISLLTPVFIRLNLRLLGLSAFAGFVVLIAGWPLNSFIAKRSIRIQKGLLAARDKRMGVLNELISAVSILSLHCLVFLTLILCVG